MSAPARATLDTLLAQGQITAEQHRQLCAALAPATQADVGGSGAIAQGERAQALGERALAVAPGNQGTVIKDDSVHIHLGGAASTAASALRRDYLRRIWQQCENLSVLAGGDARNPVRLGAVYTALMTGRRDEPEAGADERLGASMRTEPAPRLSAVAVLDLERRLVLLGGPGSGKSTFINYVAQCMAGELLGEYAPALAPRLADLKAPLPPEDDGTPEPEHPGPDDTRREPTPQRWRHPPLLPVLVVLRDLAAQLPAPGTPVDAGEVWRYVCKGLDAAALADFAPHLKAELHEHGGLVMFDGLDEVPEAHTRRQQIQKVVGDFAATFSQCRVLVTSRTYAYQQQDWKLPGFAEAPLAPFGIGQIRAFVRAWYRHMVQLRPALADAEGRAARLLLQVEHHPRIRELAERPLLLTLLARLQTDNQGDLPSRREQLYFDAVKLLLNDWEREKLRRNPDGTVAVDEPSLTEWLSVGPEEIRSELNRLAFEAHRDQPELEGTADLRQEQVVAALLRACAGRADARPLRLQEYLRDRAGILVEHGVGMFQFPHRSFQEYLAACWLANDDFPDQLARLARSNPTRWREVTRLAAAHAARGNSGLPTWALVEALCDRPAPAAEAMAGVETAQAWGALLAGEVLVASGEHEKDVPRLREKLKRMRRWQLALLTRGSRHLPVAECALAGRQLDALGDPRIEVTTLDEMPFCIVPAGLFMMGEGDEPAEYGPLHRVDLPYAYAIARWPVSTAQWREFVAASGHAVRDPQSLEGPGNGPANCVTWREAIAFCRFMTARWKQALPPGWVVTLPSEGEWEKAARGGLRVPAAPQSTGVAEVASGLQTAAAMHDNASPQRQFPWGDGFDGEPVNIDEHGIGAPSALGLGASVPGPYGCEDLAGNVWEWTRSVWGEDVMEPACRYPFVAEQADRESTDVDERRFMSVRGGCWVGTRRYVRCAQRGGDRPGLRGGLLGFRVVLRSPPVS